MQFSIPRVHEQQEQSLAWAQDSNLSWASNESGTRQLSQEEAKSLRSLTALDAKQLSPGVFVVDLVNRAQGTIWTKDAFSDAVQARSFAPGTWAWDAKSASWRALSYDPIKHTQTLKESELAPVATEVSPGPASKNREPYPHVESSEIPETARTVNEINVFKDEKQHIFYSLKHLKLKVEQGLFSMADWGWDDDADDWIPLSDLLPKISHHFAEEDAGVPVDDSQKWLGRIERLEAENNRLTAERDKHKAAANARAGATLEKQDMEEELEKLQRELEDSQRREARARREFQAEVDQLKESHHAEVESLQQKLYTLEKSTDELREELSQTEKSAQEKSDNLKSSQMTRKQQEGRIEEMDGSIERLKKSVKSLQSDLALEKKAHEERTESEARLIAKVDELQESFRERKNKVESLESEMADRRNDRDLIAAELREQMDRMASISSNLDKLAARLDR